ncbi:MAG: hypothetical protein M1142_02305 [Patescibacteria group bacterium]|nr:hypothetical protein [Patescibacteria group bacterium]
MKKQGDNFDQIKELLETIRDKVDRLEMFQHVTAEQVRNIKDQLSVVNKKLDTHSSSLVNIESKLDAYGDMYKINKHNIERLDTRLSTVEDNLEIEPPENLKVPHFAE